MFPSRRAVLRTVGPVLVGGVAGCTSRLSAIGRTETPDDWPDHETDVDEPARWRLTHEYSPDFRPMIGDGTVCIGWRTPGKAGGGAVTMVDAKTGSLRSHQKLSYPLMDQPVFTDGNFYLYTGIRAGQIWDRLGLRAFAPDGTERWNTERRQGRINFLDIGGGRAYFGTGLDHSSDALDFPLYSIALEDGSWTKLGESGTTSFGAYHDGRLLVYAGSRSFVSHDPSTGTLQWRADGRRLTDACGRAVLAGDVAYVQRRDGVAAIDLQDGSETWNAALGDVVWGAAVGEETVVAIPLDDRVYGLDPADGTERWRVETTGSASQPLLAQGTVFVSDDGTLHAIDAATGERRWRVESTASIDDYGRGMLVTVDETDSGEEIVARDVGDGTVRWRYETPDLGGITVGESHTYAAVGDDGVVALGES